jgi:hypothetical protein
MNSTGGSGAKGERRNCGGGIVRAQAANGGPFLCSSRQLPKTLHRREYKGEGGRVECQGDMLPCLIYSLVDYVSLSVLNGTLLRHDYCAKSKLTDTAESSRHSANILYVSRANMVYVTRARSHCIIGHSYTRSICFTSLVYAVNMFYVTRARSHCIIGHSYTRSIC